MKVNDACIIDGRSVGMRLIARLVSSDSKVHTLDFL